MIMVHKNTAQKHDLDLDYKLIFLNIYMCIQMIYVLSRFF